MKWVTRDFVHLDRVASPWLIKRFVDRDAIFVFVPWGKEDSRPGRIDITHIVNGQPERDSLQHVVETDPYLTLPPGVLNSSQTSAASASAHGIMALISDRTETSPVG